MNEPSIDYTSDKIANYIEYLEETYDLVISIDFAKRYNFIYGILRGGGTKLSKYCEHTNMYCGYVKNDDARNRLCMLCLAFAMKKSRHKESYVGTCHAGVHEYVRRFNCGGDVAGIVNVSGYRDKSIPFGQNEWYDEGMKNESVPYELLETLIPPLCAMLSEFVPKVRETSSKNMVYERMLVYINEQHANVSLDSLSKEFNYSKSYISHMFKRESKYTLKEYCNRLKIEEAKVLLEESNSSVTNIALAVGFNNFSYFINTFKRLTGETPLAWRKRVTGRE